MNIMFRIGGIFALLVTIAKILDRVWTAAPEVIKIIATHSSFMYGIAVGIIVSSFTKNLWLILLAIGGVYFLLAYVGI
jgi:hypothetical protein